jgi:YbgC/YbaW family acyl-CoA thioester hydrolase
MTRNDFRFLDRLRVRWAEIDAQGIVFNGHYLMFFDTALAGYWRALALPYAQTMRSLGGDLFMRKASVEYHASARYDDLVDVGIRCTRIGNSSSVFSAGVFRQDECLVGGELVYAFADPATQTSKPVPPELRAVLLGFEAGEPMLDVRVGTWSELGLEAQAIRGEVFIDEQKVPVAMERDAADADATHALARNRLGLALGTGRMLEQPPGVARIGRMAVRRGMRGSGVGRALLDALVHAARKQGRREVLLHAQSSAAGFYLQAGFTARGPQFEEAGIAHVEMTLAL